MAHQVPKTILEQLGGRKFMAMTGVRSFIGTEDSLIFMLPNRPGYVKQGINKVVITLTLDDDYTVEFYRMSRGMPSLKERCTDIYNDNLQECFTRVTGLETRMPKISTGLGARR